MNGGIIGKVNKRYAGVFCPNDYGLGFAPTRSVIPAIATVIDPLSTASGRTQANCTVSANASIYKYGGAGLNIVKTATNVKDCLSGMNSIANVVISGKKVGCFVYIKDATALGKINVVQMRLGQAIDNAWYWTFAQAVLSAGWNKIETAVASPTGTIGSPSASNVDYGAVLASTVNNADTLAAGDVVFNALYMYDI